MRHMFLNVFSILLICHSVVFSQADTLLSVLIDGRSYAVLQLTRDLLKFPPQGSGLPSDIRAAAVPIPDTLGKLFICCGRTKDSNLVYFAFHLRNNRTATLSWLDARQGASDTLHTTFEATLLQGRRTPFPIDICIVSSTNELLFRWVLSPPNYRVPGGRPTPADVAVDVGKSLPELSLKDLSGNTVSTKHLLGKPAIINWWATQCTGCILEMPGLDSLVTIFTPRISFLAIAHDSAQDVLRFLKDHRFRFLQTIGNDSATQLLGDTVPRTLVLDAKGTVVLDLLGGGTETYKEVEHAVNAIIQQ